MKNKSSLIVGASGLVGGYCLRFLLEDHGYDEVHALVRRPLGIRHAKLREHVIDFDRMESFAGLLEVRDVFCCLGTTIRQAKTRDAFYTVDFTYPHSIAREAVSRGAERFFIVTAMGASPRSLFFYNRVKGEVEEAILELPYKAVHIFRPSLLLGERALHRPGEMTAALIAAIISPFMKGPLLKYRPIHAEAVARAMVAVADMGMEGGIHESDRIQAIYDEALKET